MKHLTFALVALFFSALACGAPQTLYVDGGEIKTAAGEPFVMRGFNEMFVWSDDPRGERLIPEIARTGANALRLVWSYQYPDLRDLLALIDRTLAHKMVAIVECHDATGKWGDQLQRCVDFWKNPLLVEAIESNRRWTILNIANEAGAQGISDEAFIATYQQAVRQLRDRGYTVPIMIDAAVWGQDIAQLLRTAPSLLAQDRLHNLIFSAHSYWPESESLARYQLAARAREQGVALVIGEGPSVTRVGQCENPRPLPYLEGMAILQRAGVGWLNWSWGGMKNGDCDNYRYFDITEQGEFGRWSHEPGAQIVALSPDSVMQTSVRPASFYEDGRVAVSGVYLHLPRTSLVVGQSERYQVLLAPVNASDPAYTIAWQGDRGTLVIDRAASRIRAQRAGRGELVVTSADGHLSWRVPVEVRAR